MSTKIFVNLPAQDLDKSKEFFTTLGYSFNAQFTDENAASLVISDDIYAMLLTEPYFKGFTQKEIVDTSKSTEVLIALSTESRQEVDEVLARALAAGAIESSQPQEHGFMYSRAFDDLDGHTWEILWMDPTTIEPS